MCVCIHAEKRAWFACARFLQTVHLSPIAVFAQVPGVTFGRSVLLNGRQRYSGVVFEGNFRIVNSGGRGESNVCCL